MVNGMFTLSIQSQSQLFDADGNGQEFGVLCTSGVSINESTTDLISPSCFR